MGHGPCHCGAHLRCPSHTDLSAPAFFEGCSSCAWPRRLLASLRDASRHAAQDVPDAQRRRPAAELNLINLPTTTSLNNHQSYFRLTHRFARDLRRGDFGSLAEDFFSLDNGAVIGLEYRFGSHEPAASGRAPRDA